MTVQSRPKNKWKLPSFSKPKRSPSPTQLLSSRCELELDYDLRPLRPEGEADILLILPNYAAHIVPCPPNPTTGQPEPGPSRLIGEVEMRIPKGGRRVKAIRLIRREFSWLDAKDKDGWEVLDEAVSDIWGEADLSEGVHRFPINEILPPTLTLTSSWHNTSLPQTGTLFFAQAIGERPEDYPGHDILDISNLPWSPKEQTSDPPTYTSANNENLSPALEQTISHWRVLFAEPDTSPNGDPIRLDDRFVTVIPELGVLQCRTFTDNLSIGGPLVARFRILSPSPKTTIISARILLLQHETIESSGSPVKRPVKMAECVSIGKYKQGEPVTDVLWKGVEVGGTDEGSYEQTKHGRFPVTDRFWWSSVPGTNSPLSVSHELVYQVYFSVYGQDVYGRPMEIPGPGEVRVAQRVVKLIMPSCSAIPGIRGLPEYGSRTLRSELLKPCATCGKQPISRVCKTCSSSRLPHIAHDDGPDYCATCAGQSLIPLDQRNRDLFRCACLHHTTWLAAGCPDEGLKIPEDDLDPTIAASIREVRRDEMTAVKLDAEWSGKV